METAATGFSTETLSAAMHELLRGQDSAQKLRDLLIAISSGLPKPIKEEQGVGRTRPPATAEDLVGDVIRSFNSTLSILNSGDSGEVSQVAPPLSSRDAAKSEESEESSKTTSSPRDRRGCYKRRKSSNSWTTLSPNFTDDGHQWRKYGQKTILNTNFPRSYFRCTHKVDQGCQATKQVQKISDDPPVFRTVYHGQHTCRNLLRTPPIILGDSSPSDSSILLSFKTDKPSNNTSHAQSQSNKSVLFPCSRTPVTSSTVKCEAKEGILRNFTDGSCNQSSSYEYENFPSPDFTVFGSMTGSDQEETLSSSHSFGHDMDLMIDGGVDFEDIYASL